MCRCLFKLELKALRESALKTFYGKWFQVLMAVNKQATMLAGFHLGHLKVETKPGDGNEYEVVISSASMIYTLKRNSVNNILFNILYIHAYSKTILL